MMADVANSPAPARSFAGLNSVRRVKLAFLAAGFASLVLSVTLWFTGNHQEGIFVGLWVPAIHSLGALVLAPER